MRRPFLSLTFALGFILSACATAAGPPQRIELPVADAMGLTPVEILARLGLQSDGHVYASALRAEEGAIYTELSTSDLFFGARCTGGRELRSLSAATLTFRDGRLADVNSGGLNKISLLCVSAGGFVEEGGVYAAPFLPLAVVGSALTPLLDDADPEDAALSRIVVGAPLSEDVRAWVAEHPGQARRFAGERDGETELRFFQSANMPDDQYVARVRLRGAQAIEIVRYGDHRMGRRCRVIAERSMLCDLGTSDVSFAPRR